MSKHTPGPWRWHKADPQQIPDDWVYEQAQRPDLWNALEHEPLTPGVPTVLTYSLSDGEALIVCSPANAALIETAPELLAACEYAVNVLEGGLGYQHELAGAEPWAMELHRRARAAIAKATKEPDASNPPATD